MIQARGLIIAFLLLTASLVLAEQSAEPMATEEIVAVTATSVTVQSGFVSCGSIRLPVQKVLHPRALTVVEDRAVRTYMSDPSRACALRKAGNYEATEASIRLLLGIEQAHLPLAWRPKDYMSSAQIVWQMLKYLDTYVDVPVQPVQPALILPPLMEAARPAPAPKFELCAKVPGICDISRTERISVCVGHAPCGRSHENDGSAYRIGEAGGSSEHLLGAVGFEWCDRCQKEHEPGTCDPDEDPPPPPTGGEVGADTPPCNTSTPGGQAGNMAGVPTGYSGTGNTAPGIPSGPSGTTYNPGAPETPGRPDDSSVNHGEPPGNQLQGMAGEGTSEGELEGE